MKQIIVAVLVTVVAAGCGGSANTGSGLTGSVVADGSSTVFPISQAVAETFNEEEPDVRISVGVSGTGGGFKKFCSDETDISNASRPMKEEERALCEQAQVEFVELEVALDGLAVVVNPENDFLDCLTMDELAKIWGPESQVDSWDDIRSGLPSTELNLYGPGTDSGTFDYFTEAVNGKSGASRSDYTASEDDNVLVQGVAGDEAALGYFGFAYYEENQDKLRLLGIDGGEGCVRPTTETINSGEYPLSRPLYVYVSKESAKKEEVKAFMDFYMDVVSELAGEVGYIPLGDEEMRAQIEAWESFSS